MPCKICTSHMTLFGEGTVLGRHAVEYFRCDYCGFIQPEAPYWLDEAYREAITASDVGLVSRNSVFASVTQAVILSSFRSGGKFLDYGGGYGLFVRMLRDMGFDFYRLDKFCANLFAQGFDADAVQIPDDLTPPQFELTTAFEVFEHLVDPISEIESMLQFSQNILFSTLLVPMAPPRLDDWWYYGLEHGQHVALYTRKSLAILAERFQLNFYTNTRSLHLLTPKNVSPLVFNMATRYSVAIALNLPTMLIRRRHSLTMRDYQRVTGKALR